MGIAASSSQSAHSPWESLLEVARSLDSQCLFDVFLSFLPRQKGKSLNSNFFHLEQLSSQLALTGPPLKVLKDLGKSVDSELSFFGVESKQNPHCVLFSSMKSRLDSVHLLSQSHKVQTD